MEFNYILNSCVGSELICIDGRGLVVDGDSKLARSFIGLSLGAVKTILKRRLPGVRLIPILLIQLKKGRTWAEFRAVYRRP